MNIGTKQTCILSRAKKLINMLLNPTHSKSSPRISQMCTFCTILPFALTITFKFTCVCIYVFDRLLVDGFQYSQVTFFLTLLDPSSIFYNAISPNKKEAPRV